MLLIGIVILAGDDVTSFDVALTGNDVTSPLTTYTMPMKFIMEATWRIRFLFFLMKAKG